MKKQTHISLLLLASLIAGTPLLPAHPDAVVTNRPAASVLVKSTANIWNAAKEPADWWTELKQVHGHVGPWNVLGWRMGKAALRELGSAWGAHELDVVCHIPLKTPYSCLADGLVVGTGNSIGRLDLRLAEVMTESSVQVSIRRKDGTGPVLLFKPDLACLHKIRHEPEDQLEPLSRECGRLPEKELFLIEKISRDAADAKPSN
jgi:formylmethanofuran dehydrogenase subunit E